MSLVFSDSSTYKGIVQLYEKELGFQYGDVSGNTTRLKSLTADVNLAYDDFVRLALQASGTWVWDDSNQTDYPIISTNLISGQRDYSFTTDGASNLILDIYRVFVANSAGVFTEIQPVDVNTGTDQSLQYPGSTSGRLYANGTSTFTDGQNTTGIPTRYDKLANAIFLDPIPNYNYSLGLKVYINREPSYFVYTDTTRKAGIPGILQKYLYMKPASDYARRNSLKNYPIIQNEVLKLEGDESRGIKGQIQEYFSARTRDERRKMVVLADNTR